MKRSKSGATRKGRGRRGTARSKKTSVTRLASRRKGKAARSVSARAKVSRPARRRVTSAVALKGRIGPRYREILTPEALDFLAALHRAFEGRRRRLIAARADADRAVTINPKNPDALLERGTIRQMDGDTGGAMEDWRRVKEIAPNSTAAQTAEANLARATAAAPKGAKP